MTYEEFKQKMGIVGDKNKPIKAEPIKPKESVKQPIGTQSDQEVK